MTDTSRQKTPAGTAAAWFAPQRVLPPFRQGRSRIGQAFRTSTFFAICILMGLLYGFFFTVLPPQMLVFLALPLLILALFIIWALPEMETGPTGLLMKLFFTYVAIIILWPKYLALQIPGLPWISFRRLLGFPLMLTLLICFSVSAKFRTQVKESLGAMRPVGLMLAVFIAIQILTLPMSATPFESFENLINYWFLSTSMLFVAAWACSKPGVAEKLITRMLIFAGIVCFIGFAEHLNGRLLWVDNIPSFFKIDDSELARYLRPASRDGAYRVLSTFANPLVMAEFLALMVPFAIHKIMTSKSIWIILLWGLVDLGLLGGVNLGQSRLGILGWVVAHAVYGCFWGFRRWKRNRADLIGPSVSLIYPIGAVIFFIGMFTIPAIRNRTIGGGSTAYSDNARERQFEMMWPKLLDNPFGYGAGRSGQTLQFRIPGGFLTTDSYIITMLLDYGVIGFSLFFGMFLYAFWRMVKLYWESTSDEFDWALPMAAMMAVLIQARSVLSLVDNLAIFYTFLGMCIALAWRAQRVKGGAGKPVKAPPLGLVRA